MKALRLHGTGDLRLHEEPAPEPRDGELLLLSRRMEPADLPRAIRLVAGGRVELGPLVSARYALSEGQEAFGDLVERRGLKTILEPQRSDGSVS